MLKTKNSLKVKRRRTQINNKANSNSFQLLSSTHTSFCIKTRKNDSSADWHLSDLHVKHTANRIQSQSSLLNHRQMNICVMIW